MPRIAKGEKITDDDSVIFILQRYCQGERIGITARMLANKTGMDRSEASEKLAELTTKNKVYYKTIGRTKWYYLKDSLLKRHGGVRRGL